MFAGIIYRMVQSYMKMHMKTPVPTHEDAHKDAAPAPDWSNEDKASAMAIRADLARHEC